MATCPWAQILKELKEISWQYRKIQNKYGCQGLPAGSVFSPENLVARFKLANLHLNKPQDLWNNIGRPLRLKWSCLVIMNSIQFRVNQKHINTKTSHQLSCTVAEAWWFGFIYLGDLQSSTQTRTPLYNKVFKSNVRPKIDEWRYSSADLTLKYKCFYRLLIHFIWITDPCKNFVSHNQQ